MKSSEQIDELAAALAMAQAELQNPPLDSVNPHFKSRYTSLATLRNAILPVVTRHGLSVLQQPMPCDNGVACTVLILHKSGQWIELEPLRAPLDKPTVQGVASAMTYLKRVTLQAAFVVVGDDDDDGNHASAPSRQQQKPKPPTDEVSKKFAARALAIDFADTMDGLMTAFAPLKKGGAEHGIYDRPMLDDLVSRKDRRKYQLETPSPTSDRPPDPVASAAEPPPPAVTLADVKRRAAADLREATPGDDFAAMLDGYDAELSRLDSRHQAGFLASVARRAAGAGGRTGVAAFKGKQFQAAVSSLRAFFDDLGDSLFPTSREEQIAAQKPPD